MYLAFFYMTSLCFHVVGYQQKSPHHIGIKTALVPPFYDGYILVESLSLFITHFAKVRGERNPSGNAESAFLKTYELLIAHMLSVCHQPYQHIVHDLHFFIKWLDTWLNTSLYGLVSVCIREYKLKASQRASPSQVNPTCQWYSLLETYGALALGEYSAP